METIIKGIENLVYEIYDWFARVLTFQKLVSLTISCLLIAGVVGVRYSFITPQSYLSGQYSDFTSLTVYLFDACLIFLIIVLIGKVLSTWIWSTSRSMPVSVMLKKFVTYETLGLRLFQMVIVVNLSLALLSPFRSLVFGLGLPMLLLSVMFESKAVRGSVQVYGKRFGLLVVILGVVQSVLAFAQFLMQHSIGLPGAIESNIAANISGVATIQAGGLTFVRAYGTFPHPNILAGSLVLSIYLCLWLSVNSARKWPLLISSPILALGLILTFSRGALAALVVGMLTATALLFARRAKFGISSWVLPVLILLMVASFWFALQPLNKQRLPSLSEPAFTERMDYNAVAKRMISDKPLSGIGLGGSVIHMEQYAGRWLWPWEFQPIHNLPLLLWAETGLLGFFGIFITICMLARSIGSLKNDHYLTWVMITCSMISVLVLSLFDHYFYTLRPGQVLFWGYLLVISSAISKSSVASDNDL